MALQTHRAIFLSLFRIPEKQKQRQFTQNASCFAETASELDAAYTASSTNRAIGL